MPSKEIEESASCGQPGRESPAALPYTVAGQSQILEDSAFCGWAGNESPAALLYSVAGHSEVPQSSARSTGFCSWTDHMKRKLNSCQKHLAAAAWI